MIIPSLEPILRPASLSPQGLALAVRLLLLDYVLLALQGSAMTHFQTPHTACQLAPLAAVLVGFRQGPLIGAAHGLFLGLASGALLAEPTGIPAAVSWLLGWIAGISREGFQIERRPIRLWLAVSFIAAGEVLAILFTLAVWQVMPPALPLSLLVYALLAWPVDLLITLFLPGV